jgi:hypothetical protein
VTCSLRDGKALAPTCTCIGSQYIDKAPASSRSQASVSHTATQLRKDLAMNKPRTFLVLGSSLSSAQAQWISYAFKNDESTARYVFVNTSAPPSSSWSQSKLEVAIQGEVEIFSQAMLSALAAYIALKNEWLLLLSLDI